MHSATPKFWLSSSSKVTMYQRLHLLSICLINFDDFSPFGPYQYGFRLFQVVKRAHSCGKLGHGHQVNDLLLHKLSIPQDNLPVVATSNYHSTIVNIYNLPQCVSVSFDRLPQSPALPDL